MNANPRLILLLAMGFACAPAAMHAQDAESEDGELRVQYQLILPEEKTPETVKPEEHNPFESESEAQNRLAPGDTEENRVRDRLLKLPVVGTKRMENGGMRVLLGNLILETGKVVPPVLPDQLVELKVKNITPQYIELAWQEKRASGLPPKLMIIPINISPKVRYQMLGQVTEDGKEVQGVNATLDLPLRSLIAEQAARDAPPPPRATRPADPLPDFLIDAPLQPLPASAPPATAAIRLDEPPAVAGTPDKPVVLPAPEAAPSPTSPVIESAVRMLFGNPAPAPK